MSSQGGRALAATTRHSAVRDKGRARPLRLDKSLPLGTARPSPSSASARASHDCSLPCFNSGVVYDATFRALPGGCNPYSMLLSGALCVFVDIALISLPWVETGRVVGVPLGRSVAQLAPGFSRGARHLAARVQTSNQSRRASLVGGLVKGPRCSGSSLARRSVGDRAIRGTLLPNSARIGEPTTVGMHRKHACPASIRSRCIPYPVRNTECGISNDLLMAGGLFG